MTQRLRVMGRAAARKGRNYEGWAGSRVLRVAEQAQVRVRMTSEEDL